MKSRTCWSSSAKRSTCCGAGRVFWTADRSSEPTVVLGYCGDPLEYWSAVVLGRAFIFSRPSGTFRKLPMSEHVDLANSTRLGRVFFVPSHQVLEERGRYPPSLPPRDFTLASDGHHPSAVPEAVKYIHSPTLCLGCTLEGF